MRLNHESYRRNGRIIYNLGTTSLPTQDRNSEAVKGEIDGLDYMHEDVITALFTTVKNEESSKDSVTDAV